jgi:hypothetical protein
MIRHKCLEAYRAGQLQALQSFPRSKEQHSSDMRGFAWLYHFYYPKNPAVATQLCATKNVQSAS